MRAQRAASGAARNFLPTNGRPSHGPVDRGPLSLFIANSSERRFVKGGVGAGTANP